MYLSSALQRCFLLLSAKQHRFHQANGFHRVFLPFCWFKVKERTCQSQSFGLMIGFPSASSSGVIRRCSVLYMQGIHTGFLIDINDSLFKTGGINLFVYPFKTIQVEYGWFLLHDELPQQLCRHRFPGYST